MLDTNHFLSFERSPLGSPPMGNDMDKAGVRMDHDRHVYHSLKEGGQSIAACTQDIRADLCSVFTLGPHLRDINSKLEFESNGWKNVIFYPEQILSTQYMTRKQIWLIYS